MTLKILTGRCGEMEKTYNTRLRDRIWKLIPIYEGRNECGNIVYERAEAVSHFKKNLNRVCTEISGNKNNNDSRKIEVMNLLEGMKEYGEDKHSEVRDIVFYCCGIVNDWGD